MERPVSPVHDEEIDVLAGEIGECLGHDPRTLRLDMENVGMTAQEAQHTADLFLAFSRSQIVEYTDSQIGSDLFVSEARPAPDSDPSQESPWNVIFAF